MKPRPRLAALLWVFAFALIATRTGEAHLHLCFDGHEPFSTFHASDDGPLCDEGADGSTGHQDKDVDPLGGALSKSDPDLKASVFVSAADVVLAILPAQRSSGDFGFVTQSVVDRHPRLFLPLFRGPPR